MSKDEFQEVAFQIEERKINLSLPPSDGIDYLNRVILEKKNMDEIVTVNLEESKIKKQTPSVTEIQVETSQIQNEQDLLPSKDWKQIQIADFSDVRRKVSYFKSQANIQNAVTLPGKKEEAWKLFCFGNEDHEANLPTLSTMLSMRQRVLLQLLDYHIEWLEEEPDISPLAGRWIYAILACLELPLCPNTHSQIRTLARRCKVLRASKPDATFESTVPATLFICIVSLYFHQLDLDDMDLNKEI